MSKLLLVASIGALSMEMGASIPGIAEIEFPAKLTLTSHAPFNLSLPEVGAFIRPGSAVAIEVKRADDLLRTINSVSQIAFLNKSERLLDIHLGHESTAEPEPEPEPEAEEVAQETAQETAEEVAQETAEEPVKADTKTSAKASKSQKKEGK